MGTAPACAYAIDYTGPYINNGEHYHMERLAIFYDRIDGSGQISDNFTSLNGAWRLYVTAHEFGHVMSLLDHENVANCGGNTIMSYLPDPFPSSSPNCDRPTAADACAAMQAYGYITGIELVDTDGDGLINGCGDFDDDGDGCSDVEELGLYHLLGGQRDPLNFWDFYEVNGTNSIGLADTLLILQHFGDPGTGIHGGVDHNLLDRFIPNSAQGWLSAEADGGIGLADALANLRSFGDGCAASASASAAAGGPTPTPDAKNSAEPSTSSAGGDYSMEVNIVPAADAVGGATFVAQISVVHGGVTNPAGCYDGLVNAVDDDGDTLVDESDEAGLGDPFAVPPFGCYSTAQWHLDYDQTRVDLLPLGAVANTGITKFLFAPSQCNQKSDNGSRALAGCANTAPPPSAILAYTGAAFNLTFDCIAGGTADFTLVATVGETFVSDGVADLPIHVHHDSIECTGAPPP